MVALKRSFFLALGLSPLIALFASCSSDSNNFTAKRNRGGGGTATGGGAGDDGGAPAGGGTAGSAGQGGSTGGSGGTTVTGGVGPGGADSGGEGGAIGGSAGAGGACPDDDDDGETTCDGDCDDQDPQNNTTNAESCGDSADNNCDGNPDEGCMGLGTYVSSAIGLSTNPGTQAAPVDTIARGMANAAQIVAMRPGPIAVYVGEGHYTEKVTLAEGISILGDYQCDMQSCTWARDAAVYDSAIFGTDADGTLATDVITRATVLDGLRLMGQDGAPSARGRAALTLRGGTPTVTNNRVIAPNVTGNGNPAGRAHGIFIVNGSNQAAGALIRGNRINYPAGVSAFGLSGESSSGIFIEQNGASTKPAAEIRRNTIRGGAGRISTGITAWGSSSALLVEENDVVAGNSTERSFGIMIGGEGTINANLVNVTASAPSCSVTNNWCGGLESESATITVTNNVIRGVNGLRSAGVILREAEVPAGRVILNSNTIDGTGLAASVGGSASAALVLWIGTCTTCGFNGRVGEIRNNILVGGSAESRFGIFEDPSATRTQHPVALENNLFFVTRSGSGTGSLYRLMASNGMQTLLTTEAEVNALGATIMGLPVSGNLAGDPLLDASSHLGTGSPAIGQATATDAPSTDMDGERRPQGARDIGADEVP
jgi:hypothetical protein